MSADPLALVTNVRHFVGLAVAVELAGRGVGVLCHDRSFDDAGERERFALEHGGLRAIAAQQPGAIEAEVSAFGPLGVLVNNDAFPAIRAPLEEAELADLRAGLEALLVAPFALAQAFVAGFKQRRCGKIIFITSAAPLRGLPNYAMYAAARGGTNALAVSLARELAPHAVQVNAVAPNFVESPTYFPPDLLADPAKRAKITANIPLGRLAKPSEVGKLVAYLASGDADFVTGQVLPFAGGWA